MKLYNAFQYAILDNAQKLAGISHLLQNYKSEGTRDRDNGDMKGLGELVESLSDEGFQIGNLMDAASNLPLDIEVMVDLGGRYNHRRNLLAAIEKAVEGARSK